MSLHEALYVGDLKLVQTLLSEGANVNEKDGRGHTALHWSARNGHDDMSPSYMSSREDMLEMNVEMV